MGVLRDDFGMTRTGYLLLYVGLPSAFINYMIWAMNLIAAAAILIDGSAPAGTLLGQDWVQWILLPTQILMWMGFSPVSIMIAMVLIATIVGILEHFHFKWVQEELG